MQQCMGQATKPPKQHLLRIPTTNNIKQPTKITNNGPVKNCINSIYRFHGLHAPNLDPSNLDPWANSFNEAFKFQSCFNQLMLQSWEELSLKRTNVQHSALVKVSNTISPLKQKPKRTQKIPEHHPKQSLQTSPKNRPQNQSLLRWGSSLCRHLRTAPDRWSLAPGPTSKLHPPARILEQSPQLSPLQKHPLPPGISYSHPSPWRAHMPCKPRRKPSKTQTPYPAAVVESPRPFPLGMVHLPSLQSLCCLWNLLQAALLAHLPTPFWLVALSELPPETSAAWANPCCVF